MSCTEDGYINGTGLSNILVKENKNIDINFILGLINSKLINYWFGFYFTDVNIKPEQLRKIPILLNTELQDKINTAVTSILMTKKAKPQADTSALEKQIDQLVYQLYGLTNEEIAIIEQA